MAGITETSKVGYKGARAYIKQHGDASSIVEARITVAHPDATVRTTIEIAHLEISSEQRLAATSPRVDREPEEDAHSFREAQSEVDTESEINSDTASNTSSTQLDGLTPVSSAPVGDAVHLESAAVENVNIANADEEGVPDASPSSLQLVSPTSANIQPTTQPASNSAVTPVVPSSTSGAISHTATSASIATSVNPATTAGSALTSSASNVASSSSVNTPGPNHSATGYTYREQIPRSAFTGFQFQEEKCFDVTNKLCEIW